MIGIVISAKSEDAEFQHKIFHRFAGRTSLEIVIENALRCEYAQKVIVSMPSADRAFITGTSFKDPIVGHTLSGLKRKPVFHFSDAKDECGRLYSAALEHGIDTIVVINADSPILPTWIYSKMMYAYQSNRYIGMMHNRNSFQNGLWIDIIPFWLIAKCLIDNSLEQEIENPAIKYAMSKEADNVLPRVAFNLRLVNKEQISQFDYILNELSFGTDLGDLLLEMANAPT